MSYIQPFPKKCKNQNTFFQKAIDGFSHIKCHWKRETVISCFLKSAYFGNCNILRYLNISKRIYSKIEEII